MKVVIFAGGLGSRITEESSKRPKPMIEIGGRPILWHIMKIYSYYGFNDFVICLGYKGYMIKEYFADYYLHSSDVTFDFTADNRMTIHHNVAEPWKVTLVDTGLHTQTGARLKRVQHYLDNETFMLTYGDGVSDVDINHLLKIHRKNPQAIITMTAIQPSGRFGVLEIDDSNKMINRFVEKSTESGSWINGGFMVAEPQVFDYLNDDDQLVFERAPLETIAHEGKLQAYKHYNFWYCMDTLRDMIKLEDMWQRHAAPWKLW